MTIAMTHWNRVLLAIMVAGAIWAAAHRVLFVSLLCVLGVASALWTLRLLSRGRGDDVSRLDAAQPADERDHLLLSRALAWVGMAAITVELSILLWRLGAGYPDAWGSDVRLPFLCLVWFVANRVVTRRAL